MALTLSKIDINPVSKLYTAVGTQDASAIAQTVYCGFTPKVVTIYRTDLVGTDFYAVNTSTPGALTGLTGVSFQVTSGGVKSVVASNAAVFLSGSETAPAVAAVAAGQPTSPAQASGFTIGAGITTASTTVFIVAEG